MRRSLASFMLLAAVMAGCTDGGSGPGGGTTTDIDLNGAGFNDTGVEGFGALNLPNSWLHLFGTKANADPDRECRDLQQCGVAGVVSSFGLLTGEHGDFAVVTTGNFQCDPDDLDDFPPCPNPEIVVAVSGMTTSARVDTDDDQEWTGAELVFRYALLSGRDDPGGSADSVVIRAGPEGGPMTTVLRLSSDNLGTSLPLRSGGCGIQELPDTGTGGVSTNYPACSEWLDGSADITDLIGNSTVFQFIAGEAGAAIALALDSVRIRLSR